MPKLYCIYNNYLLNQYRRKIIKMSLLMINDYILFVHIIKVIFSFSHQCIKQRLNKNLIKTKHKKNH